MSVCSVIILNDPSSLMESHNCQFFCLNRLNGFSNGHFPSVNMSMHMPFPLFFGACTKTTTHQHTNCHKSATRRY